MKQIINEEIKRIKKEKEKVIETFEIISNKKIMKELQKSIEDFKKGRFTILEKGDVLEVKSGRGGSIPSVNSKRENSVCGQTPTLPDLKKIDKNKYIYKIIELESQIKLLKKIRGRINLLK